MVIGTRTPITNLTLDDKKGADKLIGAILYIVE
jgi:hypothetical protein